MATRVQTLAPQHIEALNLIDLDFETNRKFKPVRSAWKAYLSHLTETPPDDPQLKAVYFSKRPELLTDLLYEMGRSQRHDFDRTQIAKEVYLTTYQAKAEADLEIIRIGLAAVLGGKAPFPMAVTSFPTDPDTTAAQAEYLQLAAKAMREGKPWPVEIINVDQKIIQMPNTGQKG